MSKDVDKAIQEFKDCGSRVRVTHYRLYKGNGIDIPSNEVVELSHAQLRKMKEDKVKGLSFEYNPHNISCKGGRTTIEVTLPDETQFKSEAKCHETLDNFDRKRGKRIAWGRFTKQYHHFFLMQLGKKDEMTEIPFRPEGSPIVNFMDKFSKENNVH